MQVTQYVRLILKADGRVIVLCELPHICRVYLLILLCIYHSSTLNCDALNSHLYQSLLELHLMITKMTSTQETRMEAMHSSTPNSYQDVVFGTTS